MAGLRTYAPKDVFAVFGAIPLIYDLAPDSFLTIERNAPVYTTKPGMYGKVARLRNSDNSATIKFRCFKSSNLNDALSAHLTLDQKSAGGIGVVPFLLKELNGLTSMSSVHAYIVDWPQVTYSNEIELVEWTILAENLEIFIGGNI